MSSTFTGLCVRRSKNSLRWRQAVFNVRHRSEDVEVFVIRACSATQDNQTAAYLYRNLSVRLCKNEETSDERGCGIARKYYGSPSNHVPLYCYMVHVMSHG